LNWFNFDFRKLLRLAMALSLPLLSIQVQRKPSLQDTWFDRPFSYISSSIEAGLFSFADEIRSTTLLYMDLIRIKRESELFASENLLLRSRLLAMAELRKENERLQALMDFKTKSKMDLIAARVVAQDLLSSDHSTIRINKGTHHGLKSGLAVITTQGIVGHTFRTESFSTYVMLLSDRYTVVDGVVSRSRARGLVEGQGAGKAGLHYVEKSVDVQQGDLIVTSGLDNIFPKGFPVAIVDSVENKPYSVSLKVVLTPVVDPNQIEEVFVILNAAEEEFPPFAQNIPDASSATASMTENTKGLTQ